MLELWRNYVSVFRKLICDGWRVYKSKGSCIYWWVYPYTSLPTKFKMRVANEINTYTNNSARVFGSTRTVAYHFGVFYTTDECIKRMW